MPGANARKVSGIAAESSSRESRFCEITAQPSARDRAVVRIELGTDVSIEIRNADRAALESYVLEVLTKSC